MKRPLLALLATLLLTATASAEVTSFSVKPSATDPDITTYDNPHWVYVDHDIVADNGPNAAADRHELFLWLTGTHGKGHDAQPLAETAAELGYHVVTLMYPDDVAAAECDHDSDPHTFAELRHAIIAGGHATYQDGKKEITITRADSIENRLIKLLQQLQTSRPKEHWEQFLTPEAHIKWQTLAVGGHSQGGGHAAFIGVHHPVERVLCFGAPKDFNVKLNIPAPWYSEKTAAPISHFFAFNHTSDANSCTPEQMYLNIQTLGIPGPRTLVDNESAPFKHSHILYTSEPPITLTGLKGEDLQKAILAAHVAPVSPKFADRLKPIWTYMLTEPVNP